MGGFKGGKAGVQYLSVLSLDYAVPGDYYEAQTFFAQDLTVNTDSWFAVMRVS